MRGLVTNIMMVRMKMGEWNELCTLLCSSSSGEGVKNVAQSLLAPVLVSSTLGYKYWRCLFAGKLMIYNLSTNFIKYGQLQLGDRFCEKGGWGNFNICQPTQNKLL